MAQVRSRDSSGRPGDPNAAFHMEAAERILPGCIDESGIVKTFGAAKAIADWQRRSG